MIYHKKIWVLSAVIIFVANVYFACSTQTSSVIHQHTEIEKDTVIFMERIAEGTIEMDMIDEASGIAASIQNDNTFWTHNDSGDKARIFLINNKAQYIMTCKLAGAINRDWEDIAISRDPVHGNSRIFIGDIGDNNGRHLYCTIYILDEPTVTSNENITVTNFDKITFRYDDGPKDAETLMVDPVSGDIYIVSKRDANVSVYTISYPYNFYDTLTLQKLITIPYTYIVGGDISPDGSELLMKDYSKVYYWQRKKGQSIKDLLSGNPAEPPYIQEPQGEAICWSRDARSFYTLSERSPFKISPVLYRYDKK